MRRFSVLSLIRLAVSSPAWAANSQDCPFGPEYLSQRLGQKLTVVTHMKGLLGPACEYADDNRRMKISVDAGPNPTPPANLWRKMANPPGTTWTCLAMIRIRLSSWSRLAREPLFRLLAMNATVGSCKLM